MDVEENINQIFSMDVGFTRTRVMFASLPRQRKKFLPIFFDD